MRCTGTIGYALVPYRCIGTIKGALVLYEMLWPESYTNNLWDSSMGFYDSSKTSKELCFSWFKCDVSCESCEIYVLYSHEEREIWYIFWILETQWLYLSSLRGPDGPFLSGKGPLQDHLEICVWDRCRVWLFVTPWTIAHQEWNFLGKSTGVGCHFLLQGIFLTQGSNPGLLHCRQTLYQTFFRWGKTFPAKGQACAMSPF